MRILKCTVLLILCLVSGIALAIAFINITGLFIQTRVAQEEYAALQEYAEEFEITPPLRFLNYLPEEPEHVSVFDLAMREINHDYICWLRIDGTNVDYPIVRADNNEKYLDKSFMGTENYLGALFMDYRCMGDYVPHIIIYGHNSRQGDLFGSLSRYLDTRYMANNPIITIMVNDRIVEFEIFAARKTNVNDPAYFLDFSLPGAFGDFLERIDAPEDAMQIITLSTCYGANNDDERVIVQGALRQ